jgi:hypothetical protein
LGNVVISGSSFVEQIALIPPSATVTTHVNARGESGLAIAFNAGTRRISLPEQGYFEGSGYSVAIVVRPDLSVSVKSETCWFCR